MRPLTIAPQALALVLFLGCGGGAPAQDDAGPRDAGPADLAPAPADAGGPDGGDAGVPLAGFGTIGGECGVITTADLTAPTGRVVETTLDFDSTPYGADHLDELSPGGQKVVNDDNLGGSSLLSEAFAYEVLYRCELATLLKTEREIDYQDAGGKKTDLLVTIDGLKIGVSVVRAYRYPGTPPLSEPEAADLLEGKLSDILLSSANVVSADAWGKQILSVMAYSADDAAAVVAAMATLPGTVTSDTIVVVTRTDGDDGFMYQ